jgi:hypothetical protein
MPSLTTYYLVIALLVLFFALLAIAVPKRAPQAIPRTNGAILSSVQDESELRRILAHRFKYIRSRQNLLDQVNIPVLDKVESLSKKATLDNMVALLQLTPGNRLGMLPLSKFTCPKQRILLQFEQGSVGWYWFYMVFPQQQSAVMVQLTRVELLPRSKRESLGYALGETTLYHVALAASDKGKWYRDSFVTPGTYVITGDEDFAFSTADGSFKMAHAMDKTAATPVSTMALYGKRRMASTDGLPDTTVGMSLNVTSNVPIYDNGPKGCVPCLWGDGSLYTSYTDLHASGGLTVGDTDPVTMALTDGTGWMDHQWGGSEQNSPLGKMLMSMIAGRSLLGGLPKYIWLNMNVTGGAQYMIYAFPKHNPKVGDVIPVAYNKYTPDGLTYSKNGKVTVLKTLPWKGVDYPVQYKVEVDGVGPYTIDGTPYGTAVIVDLANSEHWTGVANLLDASGKQAGIGFMEAQRFMDDPTYVQGLWQQAGSTEGPLSSFYLGQKNTSSVVVSWIFLLFIFVLWIWLSIALSRSLTQE